MVLRSELVRAELAVLQLDLVLAMALPVLVRPQALLVSDLVTVPVQVLVLLVLLERVLAPDLVLEVLVRESTAELSLTKTEVVCLDIVSPC